VARYLAVLLVPLSVACSKAPAPRPAEPPKVSERSLDDSLTIVIGEPLCKEDADCWLVQVGKKACGGPRTYTVASKRSSDSAMVRALAERLSTEEAARNVREGRMSDCSMVMPPTARCVGGRCTTQPSAGQ
jgi:hypothetical protein